MADQQLVDYIKKAKQVGQGDDQTRALLYKNGWTEAEVSEGFVAVGQAQPQQFGQEIKPQSQIQPQVQAQVQPQVQTQPKVQITRPAQSEPQYQQPTAKPASQRTRPSGRGVDTIIKIIIVLIILSILGTIGYVAVTQSGAIMTLVNSFINPQVVSPSNTETQGSVETTQSVAEQPAEKEQPVASAELSTTSLSSIAENYDITKTTVAAFSDNGDKVAYCGVDKTTGKVDCYLNDIKLDNAYAYKPYWVGISPDGNRVVFLYYDSAKKQSFTYENGVEGTRRDGTITSPSFSKDSQNFMYIVITKDSKNYAVFNSTASQLHDKIYTIPELSSDGNYMIYGARDGVAMSWVADKVK